MWKNKHVVVAMLVAPLLAIMAWFAVDYLVAERPHAARPGAAYPLVARSNCRYQSGRCDLDNADFKLSLERTGDGSGVVLTSLFALTGANAAIGLAPESLDRPIAFERTDDGGLVWRMPLAAEPVEADILRLVVLADGSTYYAETSAVFLTARANQ